MRGENGDVIDMVPGLTGTSPRARGKHSPSMFSTSSSRNIPACAGKTAGIDQADANRQEHPRVRGENREVFEGEDFYSGTSPRTRGKQVVDAEKRLDLGNIPAHAGKTQRCAHGHWPKPEHPRARGENPHIRRRTRGGRGTSPRTRGKRRAFSVIGGVARNIPAHAGKTHGRRWWAWGAGTSPRTRGKPTPARHLPQPPRNIPAHAGKTRRAKGLPACTGEHPRARGENAPLRENR